MLEKYKKKFKKSLEKLPKSFLIYSALVLIMLVIALIPNNNKIKKNSTTNNINKEEMIELFNKIQDNYQMNVTINKDELEEKYTYNTDSNIELYEIENNNEFGFFKYKDITYKIENDTKISKEENIPYYVDNPYHNIKFIKTLLDKCEFEEVSTTNTKCIIKETEYINNYNLFFNKNYNNFSTKDMEINIYYNSKISKIKIDYSNVDKIINNNNNSLIYTLDILNYNKNDFSEIIEYINTLVEE